MCLSPFLCKVELRVAAMSWGHCADPMRQSVYIVWDTVAPRKCWPLLPPLHLTQPNARLFWTPTRVGLSSSLGTRVLNAEH